MPRQFGDSLEMGLKVQIYKGCRFEPRPRDWSGMQIDQRPQGHQPPDNVSSRPAPSGRPGQEDHSELKTSLGHMAKLRLCHSGLEPATILFPQPSQCWDDCPVLLCSANHLIIGGLVRGRKESLLSHPFL